MKVAILSESSADDAAIRILIEAVLGIQTTPVSHAGLRVRGWPSVRDVFPAVIIQLHYRSDAEGLVLVVDSNDSPIHGRAHEPSGCANSKCRLCALQRTRDTVLNQLKSRVGLPALKIAIGIAVPAIEAWLLCGIDPHVSEGAWIAGLCTGKPAYSKADLKKRLYRTDRPSLELEKERVSEAVKRLTSDLASLERAFPVGFGVFAKELRSWGERPPN